MTPFTVFNADGRILRSGICQDEALPLQAREGEQVIPLPSDDMLHYVDLATLAIQAIPPRPGLAWVFDYASKAWHDPRTLAQMQDLKWAEIKKARTREEFGSFTYNGMEFDGDLDAQRRLGTYISISKSALASGSSFEAQFILADNTVVTLQAADFVAIELAKSSQVAQAFAKAAGLREAIYATTQASELDVIAW